MSNLETKLLATVHISNDGFRLGRLQCEQLIDEGIARRVSRITSRRHKHYTTNQFRVFMTGFNAGCDALVC